MQTLRIIVISAKNLLRIKGTNPFGCYVSVQYAGEKKSTTTQDDRRCVWNEIFDFEVNRDYQPGSKILFTIKRASCIPIRVKNRIIASGEVKLENAIQMGTSPFQICELALVDKYNRQTHGVLQLKFQLDDYLTIGSTTIFEKEDKESGYFIIDVYRGEGLPRMDLGNIFSCRTTPTKLVDGYLVISFADEKVTTSVIKQEVNPVWNERLYLPFNLPLQDHHLKLELKDEDIFTPDDIIATSTLAVKDITPQWHDVRQMPCFGPSFVNFYGANRQFQIITTHEMHQMNAGKEEGCSFRGRALLSISTQMGKIPNDVETEIPQSVISTTSKVIATSFILRATFMDCYLLRSHEVTTFEVSIGLYGDSQIEDSKYKRPSCVKSFRPIATNDVIPQYCAPWDSLHKPCIIYEVEIQGNIQRIERSNCYKYLITTIETFLSDVTTTNRRENQNELMQKVRGFLNSFTIVCNRLKEFAIQQEIDTDLDRHLHEILLGNVNTAEEVIREMWREQRNFQTALENLTTKCYEILEQLRSIPAIDQPNEYPDVFIWMFCNWKKEAYCRIPISDILFSDVVESRGEFCDITRSWLLKFPYEMNSSPDCRQPGILRANVWFGCQSHLNDCLKCDENIDYHTREETHNDESKWFGGLLPRGCLAKILGENDGTHTTDPKRSVNNERISLDTKKVTRKNNVGKTNSTGFTIQINGEIVEPDQNAGDVEQHKDSSRINHSSDKSNSSSTLVLPPIKFVKFRSKHNVFHFPSPSFYLQFKELHLFELRCYIYQAKELLSGDKTGFSDPFVRVTYLSNVQQSRSITESLCPIWEQTVILSNISLPGPISLSQHSLPEINIEIYDKDDNGVEEYLGNSKFYPLIGPVTNRNSALFHWIPIKMVNEPAGELLTCAELILLDSDINEEDKSKTKNEVIPIPIEMQPKIQPTQLQMLLIGLRLKNVESKSLHKPSLEFYYNKPDPIAVTDQIEQFPRESNFKNNYFQVQLMLPVEKAFLPALTARLKERGIFDRLSVTGACIITELHQFFVEERRLSTELGELTIISNTKETVQGKELLTTNWPQKMLAKLEDFDWWNKYYASKGDLDKCGDFINQGFIPIEILPNELEQESIFKTAIAKIKTYPVYRGKNLPSTQSTRELVAELKVTLEIRPTSTDRDAVTESKRSPMSSYAESLLTMTGQYQLRLYLIRAHNLTIKDFRSSDPYVRVKVGDGEAAEVSDSLRHNTLNPIFGCLYETTINWPKDVEILIEVVDKDLLGGDDLVGATIISLDDRLLAPCWATCGVAPQYMTSGPYVWRDYKSPSEILDLMCSFNGLARHTDRDLRRMTIDGVDFALSASDELQISGLRPIMENWEDVLALKALRRLNLVIKEHVETRSLYHPSQPGVQQGQLEMWLDLIPIRENILITNAVGITPRKPKNYVLRCVIYNAYDVILDENNLLGDRMSDVYVKGWLKGKESEWQKTEVHHRSLNGEANFNWRLVFPFQFLHGENVLVHKTKKHLLDVHLTEVSSPLKLCLQINDYDTFSRDDQLGRIDLDLMALSPPNKNRRTSEPTTKELLTSYKKKLIHKLSSAPILKSRRFNRYRSKFEYDFMPLVETPSPPLINMFQQKWIRGFWTCPSSQSARDEIAGEIEMEIEVLSEEEAKLKPAGLGRDEPNSNPHLQTPIRPYDSFHWLSSPLKFIKYMCGVRLRMQLIITALSLTAFIIFYIFFRPILIEKIRQYFQAL